MWLFVEKFPCIQAMCSGYPMYPMSYNQKLFKLNGRGQVYAMYGTHTTVHVETISFIVRRKLYP